MNSQVQACSTLLEFLTWFACWFVFLALQRRLCRRYPGLRTLCRMIFLWTLIVALAPGVWALVFHTVHGPRLLALLNHAFGLGVFAQTSLRSLLLVRWLGWPASQCAAAGAPLGAERFVMASMLALSQVMRAPGATQIQADKTGIQ